MSSLANLPPEILISIYNHLSVKDILSCAKCCRSLNEISQINSVWEIKIHQDFGIRFKTDAERSDATPKLFYQHVLYKYGKLLGLWQKVTEGHYGKLLQVKFRSFLISVKKAKVCKELSNFQFVYDDYKLKLIEWNTPIGQAVNEPMRPNEFLNISLQPQESDDVATKVKLVNNAMYLDQDEDDLDMIISLSGPEKFSIFLPTVGQSLPQPGLSEESLVGMMVNYLCLHTSQSLETRDVIEGTLPDQMQNFLPRFYAAIHSRNALGFRRLFPCQSHLKLPIASGIFKGTYGPHGIEMIKVSFPNSQTMEGLKLTGDPNVPMDKITFKADIQKAVIMSKQDQIDSDCDRLISSMEMLTLQEINFESGKSESLPPVQPFVVPRDVNESRVRDLPSTCLYRFLGEAQVAFHDYVNPEFIPAHLMVFDGDTFGVLFLDLRSISLYSRVKEDLFALNYADVL